MTQLFRATSQPTIDEFQASMTIELYIHFCSISWLYVRVLCTYMVMRVNTNYQINKLCGRPPQYAPPLQVDV